MATSALVVRGESCWTDEFLLGHCENYRVVIDTGEPAGVVDKVMWSEDGFEPEALLLHAPGHDPAKIVVPLDCVVELDVRAHRLVLSADAGRVSPVLLNTAQRLADARRGDAAKPRNTEGR